MARPLSELTKLILSLPRDMSVADVIAKVAEHGMSTSPSNVHHVRSKYGSRRAAKATPAKARGKKRAAAGKKEAGAAVTKAEFVRSFGPETKPAEIVVRAKEAGMELTPAYVYEIRRTAKRAAKGHGAKRAPAVRHHAAPKAAQGRRRLDSSEGAFVSAATALVLEHGLGRARTLLDSVLHKLEASVR